MDIKWDHRMPFSIFLSNSPSLETARADYKMIQSTSHTVTLSTFRPWKSVLCALRDVRVHVTAYQNRRNWAQTLAPSQRSKAIKVYSTFFRDDFIWTPSRCTHFFFRLCLLLFSYVFYRWIFSLLCHLKKKCHRYECDSNAIFPIRSCCGNCKNVLKI